MLCTHENQRWYRVKPYGYVALIYIVYGMFWIIYTPSNIIWFDRLNEHVHDTGPKSICNHINALFSSINFFIGDTLPCIHVAAFWRVWWYKYNPYSRDFLSLLDLETDMNHRPSKLKYLDEFVSD
jgi:hypothetical protein